MTDYEEAVERRARAAYEQHFTDCRWSHAIENAKEVWRQQARATFTADEKGGYVLVPKTDLITLLTYAAELNIQGPAEQRWNSITTPDWFVGLAAIAAGVIKEETG